MQIVKTAAFAFAILSWIATAAGLSNYVYTSETQKWLAYLGSFAIQGLLIVFNLKLPVFIEHAKKWNLIIVPFYFIVLFASSTFAYVYISNSVYEETRYFDSHITLESEFYITLDATDEYTNESLVFTRLLMSQTTTDLKVSISKSGYVSDSETELLNELNSARAAQGSADAAVTSAEEIYAEHYRIDHDDDRNNDPPSTYVTDDQHAIAAARQALIAANSALDVAQKAFDNRKISLDKIANEVLSAILASDFENSELSGRINELTTAIANIDHNDDAATDFSEIVIAAQTLNILSENLGALISVKADLNDLRSILTDTRTPPNKSFEGEEAAWTAAWTEDLTQLKKVMQRLPSYSDAILSGNNSSIVNTEVLKDFDAASYIYNIDTSIRFHLYDINAIERSAGLLKSRFNGLAIFSLALALFFDIASLLAGLFLWIMGRNNTKQSSKNTSPAGGDTNATSVRSTPATE